MPIYNFIDVILRPIEPRSPVLYRSHPGHEPYFVYIACLPLPSPMTSTNNLVQTRTNSKVGLKDMLSNAGVRGGAGGLRGL